MKILRELLAELKRSNDLKEKALDFEIMDDYDFGNKYGCTIWQRRQQNPIIVKVDNNPANPYNQFPNSTY
tara:strand:+ start:427 stop:636 length:210 start_codon:yes stop_codon:yes gene_type:complete